MSALAPRTKFTFFVSEEVRTASFVRQHTRRPRKRSLCNGADYKNIRSLPVLYITVHVCCGLSVSVNLAQDEEDSA